jgi:hypothetical protein
MRAVWPTPINGQSLSGSTGTMETQLPSIQVSNTMRLCTSVETGLKTGYNNLNECYAARISVEID